jgi:hypothetical protein
MTCKADTMTHSHAERPTRHSVQETTSHPVQMQKALQQLEVCGTHFMAHVLINVNNGGLVATPVGASKTSPNP